MSLVEAVGDPVRRDAIAKASMGEAAKAVASVRGLRGVTLRVGMEAIERVRPGFLEKQIHDLLPGFAAAIEPHWQTGVEQGDPSAHLQANGLEVANDLLAVSDARAESSTDATARAAYQRVRPAAPKRIAEHMPRIASFIADHAAT